VDRERLSRAPTGLHYHDLALEHNSGQLVSAIDAAYPGCYGSAFTHAAIERSGRESATALRQWLAECEYRIQ